MVPREGRVARWGVAVLRALRLVNPVAPLAVTHSAGADYASGSATGPGYSLRRAWYSYALSPWVQVCVERIAEDLAALPLVAEQRVNGEWQRLEQHATLDLLADEGRGGGQVFRMQTAADLAIAANVLIKPLLSALRGTPVALARIHPARAKAIPGPKGLLGWELDQGGMYEEVAAESMIHVRGISWADDPRSLMGTPPIQSLGPDIDADLALAQMTKRSADKGRPDALYHPAKEGVTWAPRVVALIKAQLQKVFDSSQGGVAIVDGAGKLEVIGWTPKDMEGQASRTWTRQTVLSRFGVPPTIAGIPDAANYATAQQEAVTYWTRQKSRAKLLDAAFTELAARMGSPDVRIRHDFSQVPALQQMQTDALGRVQSWVNLGADPARAARYEGFDDLPEDLFPLPSDEIDAAEDAASQVEPEPTPAPVSVDVEAAQEARDELAAALSVLEDNSGESDEEAIADALGGLRAALDAVEGLLSEASAQ